MEPRQPFHAPQRRERDAVVNHGRTGGPPVLGTLDPLDRPARVQRGDCAAHTIAIEVSGSKNPSSGGVEIVVDAFDVY
jgi:hypothetical protein